MSGIIRHFTPDAPRPVNQPGVSKAQADEKQEGAAYQASRNVRRTGGMRLLFSPLRDLPADQQQEALQKLLGTMGS
jgi:hypothetical protein